MHLIQVEKLSFSYDASRTSKIFSDLSFTLSGVESVGIIGANGVGKSTLLKLLVGLLPDYTGQIKISGMSVTKENLVKIREKLGYVFQDSDNHLFMPTVYEDVSFAPRNYGYPDHEVEARSLEALKSVHIEHLRNVPIYQLSGGEKKLVCIATLLSMRPEVILADEPSSGLDPKNRRNLIQILNGLNAAKIIASHDLDLVYDTCPRTILLSGGKIAADGKTQEILKDKELLKKNGLELPLSFSRGCSSDPRKENKNDFA